jgi:Tfp pilus assembly protein PilV
LPKNTQKATLNGDKNLTVLIPADVVNDSDPYTSKMEFNLQGSVNSSNANLMQAFVVGEVASGFIYEPTTGYVNPTYNLNIATVGVTPQTYSVNYVGTIPDGAVTDDTMHTFTASLQPTTSTSRDLQCSQLISFTRNSCQIQVTGSNGTSSEVSKNDCTQSIVVDPTKWGNTSQYLQCQYIPQIQDSNGMIESLNPIVIL